MTTLTDRVTARLDAIEATARAATPGPWKVNDESFPECITAPDGTSVVAGGRWGGEAGVFDEPIDALHIALHDPAHVLRWVAGLREIVASHRYREFQGNTVTATSTQMTLAWYRTACQGCGWGSPCPTLRAVATALGVEVS
jgi:hypothetical protein